MRISRIFHHAWVCLSGLLILGSCNAQKKAEPLAGSPDDNTLLWEISGKSLSNPSYLYGTMHMMCREDVQFSPNLLKALDQTGDIYFEMDLDDASNTLGAIFFMNMKDGKTLKDLYTPEEYARLNHFFTDSLGTGLQMFQRMKPMFLQAMLYPKFLPCKNMSGVEQELLKVAKNKNKEVKGFETIAFQASVFDSIPYEEQAKELLKGIDSINMFKPYMDTMIRVYKEQRILSMEKLFTDEAFGVSDHTDILLDQRNINWVGQLNKILTEKPVFIAVGAGHLVGEKGLIQLLRKEGYTVRGILNK